MRIFAFHVDPGRERVLDSMSGWRFWCREMAYTLCDSGDAPCGLLLCPLNTPFITWNALKVGLHHWLWHPCTGDPLILHCKSLIEGVPAQARPLPTTPLTPAMARTKQSVKKMHEEKLAALRAANAARQGTKRARDEDHATDDVNPKRPHPAPAPAFEEEASSSEDAPFIVNDYYNQL